MAPDQGTKDQMILGSLISSQDKPKVGVLCTVLDRVVQPWTSLGETVHKTPTLGLHCELIKEPRIIWSFVPWSDGISLHTLLMVKQNPKQFFLGISPYSKLQQSPLNIREYETHGSSSVISPITLFRES